MQCHADIHIQITDTDHFSTWQNYGKKKITVVSGLLTLGSRACADIKMRQILHV